MNIYKLVTLSFLMLLAPHGYAANTPDELANTLIQAIEENDTGKYEALIYPASLKFYKERDAAKYKSQMKLRFSRKKPSQYNSYEVTITDIENDKDSNLSEKRLRFYKDQWAIFPLIPEKRLNVIVKEGDVKTEGEWTVPYSSQILSRHNGRWYIVFPGDIVEIK